jgi:hypothetical protein
MDAAPYFDLVREMRDPYNHRLRLVQFARQHGIKPTARHFATTVPSNGHLPQRAALSKRRPRITLPIMLWSRPNFSDQVQ